MSSPTLVGRSREVSLLRQAMVTPPSLILVEGEAGIGKSRLVREVVRQGPVADRRVLLGHCHRLREPFLLGPIVEALRGVDSESLSRTMSPVVGALRPLLPELTGVLPPQPPSAGDPRADRHQVFRALRGLLEALGPTVCVLEDLHWTDETTLEFVSFLLSEPAPELALVLTYRTQEMPAALSHARGMASRLPDTTRRATIELSELTESNVHELICAILEIDAVTEEFAADLHRRTGGIPFLVEEVLRLVREHDDSGDDPAAQASHHIGVPAVVRHSTRERLEVVGNDARLITGSAAVLAVAADLDLLRKVAGLSRARASNAITESVSAGLLEETRDGRFGFRHTLATEAAHAETPSLERRRLHLRAGRALEALPEPRPFAQLAHHFKAAGMPRLWTRYARAAAEAAVAMGNTHDGAQLLEDALAAPGLSRADRVRIAVELGSAALSSMSPQRAIATLQRTLDEESMPVAVRGELRLSLSRLRCYVGDALWRDEMIRAVGELRRRPDLAAPAMANLAWPTLGAEKLEDHLGWLERSVRAAASTRDPLVKGVVCSQRAAILLCVGDPRGWEEVREQSEEPTSIDEKMLLLQRYLNLSLVTLGIGHCRRAESFLAAAGRIHDDLEHVRLGPWIEGARVALDWRVGRWQGLEARTRALVHSTPGRPGLSLGNQLILGSLLLGRGRVNEAEQIFTTARDLAVPRQWMSAHLAASARLGRIRLARGDAAGACHLTTAAIDVVKEKGIWAWASELAPVAVQARLQAGLHDGARDLAESFAAGLRDRDAPAAQAASDFCQGVVARAEGRHDVAARLLMAAEQRWRELPCPYEAAQACEERGRCPLGENGGRADGPLRKAMATFGELGASWDAGRVRGEMRARGIVSQPRTRDRRTALGNGLSPREAEVAHMAGSGRKNREIAETLFLSPRTVEVHVASALRKLGVGSRNALASALEDLGRGEPT